MDESLDAKCAWLIEKLANGRYSIKELEDLFLKETGEETSESSLYRWRREVQRKYHIIIGCDHGKWYIADKTNDVDMLLKANNIIDKLLIKHNDIKDKILLDNVPSMNKYLGKILKAISGSWTIDISYTKYSSDDSRNLDIHKYTIHPYCVKRFENRWYVTGLVVKRDKEDYHRIQNFSLDMINELELKRKKFDPDSSFNAAEYFKNVYGITTGLNGPFTEIKIRVSAWLANYLRTLPLHHSQKEISESDSFNVFQYTLRPANDFYNALLHFGPNAVVLSPDSVREEMKKKIQEMAEKYSK